MRPLTAHHLLSVWENGADLSSPRRALLLLAASAPDAPPAALAQLPVGSRDDLLLQLRAAAFGPRVEATSMCPRCGEKLEMTLDTEALRRPAPAESAPLTLDLDGFSICLRSPDSSDLIAMQAESDRAGADLAWAESAMLRRCVLSARAGDRELAADELPEPVVTALAARLAEADPQADVRLALACPACEHRWEEPFDIVTFFWREIEDWAWRLFREIHQLAAAYGWSESEIVALSPARRRIYLELASA